MGNFRGRKAEARALEAAWRDQASAFIPVYGRRRVGKSELIVRFMSGKDGIYYVGKRAPGDSQIHEFLETAARALNEPLLAQARVNGWREALELVVKRWPGKQKLILALDEFQWMAEAAPELPSVIQELWDRQWAKSGRVMLILCGSYLGFMEREVLGKKSPLFGRRTAQMLLRPFDYLEAAEFHPNYSAADRARVYAICGGIPMYLLAFDGRQSVEQNISNRILDDLALLAREPEFLLREELRDLIPYHAVLMALAQGATAPAQLSGATGIDGRGLSYYLQNLMELGYVQRRLPLSGGKASPRAVRYALEDPFLRFWFRFVFPHQSVLRLLGPERGFAEIIKPEIEAYYGRCFERLCREALPLLYLKEGVRAAFEIGEYWGKDVQIDVVGVRQDGWIDLGECKWGDVSSMAALDAELEAKVERYPNPRNVTIGRHLFVRGLKARAKTPEARVHTLRDLYELQK